MAVQIFDREYLENRTIAQIKELAEKGGIVITETTKPSIIDEFLLQSPAEPALKKGKKILGTMSANTFVRSRGLSAGWADVLESDAGKVELSYPEWEAMLKKYRK
jgi:hypothetical protein